MRKRLFLFLPLLMWSMSLFSGTAHAASAVNRADCTITVHHGVNADGSATIELSPCAARTLFQTGDLSQVNVVYKDTAWVFTVENSLSPQAQQAVKMAVQAHAADYNYDWLMCPQQMGALVLHEDYWKTWNRDWLDSSGWVLDHLASATYSSGC